MAERGEEFIQTMIACKAYQNQLVGMLTRQTICFIGNLEWLGVVSSGIRRRLKHARCFLHAQSGLAVEDLIKRLGIKIRPDLRNRSVFDSEKVKDGHDRFSIF